jgi:hypothetical protein
LRRIGRIDEALSEYDAIARANPHFSYAKLARLSLLIELRRFDEVLPELPASQPKSEVEWRFYFLKAVALDAVSDGKKADALLRVGLQRAPFARQRRLFSAALARKRLLRNQLSRSLEVITAEKGEISNVIWLHALAASGRKARAKSTYNEIIANETNPAIIELSSEIASRYNIIALPSTKTREWIFQAEQRELLLEAA